MTAPTNPGFDDVMQFILARLLQDIAAHDPSFLQAVPDGMQESYYTHRNKSIMQALATATMMGYDGGIQADGDEPAWVIVYIDLPTGQVSWHVPAYTKAWDGHTTLDKYERVFDYQVKYGDPGDLG